MFTSYDLDDLLEDELTIPQMPAFSFPQTTPVYPKQPTAPARATSQEQDFPFLLNDRVRVLTPNHEFTGRTGVISSFIRSISHSKEIICCVFFSCDTTLGIPASQLELDPRSQLISSALLDAVVRQSRLPKPKA